MKEKIEKAILNFIEYDNKHHCFIWFVIGFVTCTLFVEILMLLKGSN